MQGLNVQYGAGWGAGAHWLNFDASPSLRLERLPVIGRFIKVNKKRFPENNRYGDICKGLPVKNGSAKAVYASHVLEHLAYQDCLKALKATYDMMMPGGVFRLIVPNLRARAELYLKDTSPEAANVFCGRTNFGIRQSPKSMPAHIREYFGHSRHVWMWDAASMTQALRSTGFVDIRRCCFGDAEDADFREVENPGRFHDTGLDIDEVALEARKPG